MSDKPYRRRRTTISDDPLAQAIKLWWEDTEGPHSMPLGASSNNAQNLADYLRLKGFIKEEIAVKDEEDKTKG